MASKSHSEILEYMASSGMANLFSVECRYLDFQSHKIFGVPRPKNEKL